MRQSFDRQTILTNGLIMRSSASSTIAMQGISATCVPLEDEQRILIVAQAYLRGDLYVDSFVAFIDTIRMESKVKRNLEELRLDQAPLKEKYPQLFE